MANDLTATSALHGDARLRHQRARIEQRHLQFGRHCRLDVRRLMRAANRVRVAPPVQLVLECRDVGTDLMEHSTLGIINHWESEFDDAARVAAGSRARTAVPDAQLPTCRHAPGPATLGDFVASDRADACVYREWVATLSDLTTVVVNDWCGAPSRLGIEKAVSIVQSRGYLEQRARRLLLPFAQDAERWRLVTINFATEARRHGCEFLMCFAIQDVNGVLSSTSRPVEIGFALPTPHAVDPVFVLAVVTAGEVAATARA